MPEQTSTPTPRGRPRAFDENAALQAATELFWTHGYEATSISMLCAGMGIRPPSLYAAFGSKADLFLTVVDRYESIYWDPVWETFDQTSDVWQAFSTLFDSAIDVVSSPDGQQGCLVVLSSVEHGHHDDNIAVQLSKIQEDIVTRINLKLDAAVSSRQLTPETDTLALAHALTTILDGIALRARDGFEAPLLHRLARAGMGMLPIKV